MPHLSDSKPLIKARITEFSLPPITDGLVLGIEASIGCLAIRRALELLIVAPFEHIAVDDDIVGDILIRQGLLRRIPRERLVEFVLHHIKPQMGGEDILHLDLTVEVLLEEGSP